MKRTALALFCISMGTYAQSPNDPNALWAEASLYRDEWGTPHITADNLRSMAFAFGYAQAEDHLERMLLAYRSANGRLAEIYGENFIANDEFAIKMGHSDLAREAYANADAETRNLCEGFALGVNNWLFEHFDEAPAWAEGVTPTDVLAFMHYYLMSQAPFDLPNVYRRPPGTYSANTFAIGPQRSKSGNPILVLNPHTDYNDVFQWYEAHLKVGAMDVAGATLFGLPILLQGHNAALGWGLAPNAPDTADVYVEPLPQFHKPAPNSVFSAAPIFDERMFFLATAAESKPLYVSTSQGMRERRVGRMRTPRGPVISESGGRLVTYRVGGYNEFGALRQFLYMARAANLSEFQAALSLHQLPTFHIVYADREDNIFYLYNAKVGQKTTNSYNLQEATPFRSPTLVWDGPISASDSQYQWGNIIPASGLPYLINPTSGFIQACQTPPWLATTNTGMGPQDWPRWFARDVDSYRAKRVRQLIHDATLSFEDAQAMLYDILAPFALEAAPYLLRLAAERPQDVLNSHPDLPVVLDMLRDWNHLADVDSSAMTYFHLWWSTFQENPPFPVRTKDDYYGLLRENSPAVQRYALDTANEAAKRMRNYFQTLDVPWGEVHTLRRGDRDVPMPGAVSGEPLFVASDQRLNQGRWPVNYGYGYAMVIEFGDTPRAASVLPFGTSENPESPHFDDQLDVMSQRRLKLTRFDWDEVRQHAVSARGRSLLLKAPQGSGEAQVGAARVVDARLATHQGDLPAVPAGFSAFTVGLTPELTPKNTLAETFLKFTIPEVLCAQNNLQYLRMYVYEPGVGWFAVQNQRFEFENRAFIARVYPDRLFAILGPEQLLRAPLQAIDDALVARAPQSRQPVLALPEKTHEVLEAGREPMPNSERRTTVASAPPPARGATSQPPPESTTPELVPTLNSPATPSEGTPDDRDLAVGEAELLPGPSPTTPESNAPADQTAPISPSASEPRLPTEQVASAPDIDTQSAPAPEKKKRLTWSMKPPEQRKSISTLFLVPDSAIASPMVVGSKLVLKPPIPGAVFHLTMDKSVRAQVMVSDTPPTLYPDGLAAFSHVYSIIYDSNTVDGRVGITMQHSPNAVAPENVKKLKIHSYSEEEGWKPLRGQKYGKDTKNYTSLDMRPRIYVLLGPAELLVTRPSTQNAA